MWILNSIRHWHHIQHEILFCENFETCGSWLMLTAFYFRQLVEVVWYQKSLIISFIVSVWLSHWALAWRAPPPFVRARWRVRSWTEDPLSVCTLPIKELLVYNWNRTVKLAFYVDAYKLWYNCVCLFWDILLQICSSQVANKWLSRRFLCHSLNCIHPCMFLLFIYLACFAEWIMIRQSQSSALATRSWARGCVTFPLIRSVYFHLQKKEGKLLFIFLYFPVLFTVLPVLFFPRFPWPSPYMEDRNDYYKLYTSLCCPGFVD